MYNNEPLVRLVGEQADPSSYHPSIRQRARSSPCLPDRLPSLAFLRREADQNAPLAIIRQLRRSPSLHAQELSEEDRSGSDTSPLPSPGASSDGGMLSPKGAPKVKAPKLKLPPANWKPPQPFEVFRAVEKKDIMFLMEVRDHAFHLLLRKSGDATPLLHAMRIGESHRDVAIILVGALSRFVNHLEEEDLQNPETRKMLKALRTNLKLAIDFGLQRSQSDLIASYLQTLIMSEGDKWVHSTVASVSLALRAGNEAKPVDTASQAVRKFATRELNKAENIASLDDYIANATFDLVLMGAWSLVGDVVETHILPTYAFARDLRMYTIFTERVHQFRTQISNKAPKRLRWQLRVLDQVGQSRGISFRRKVELLASELDEGPGV
ncbi:hypothetical protein DL93DRAFT_2143470 [Clavulina sp. PMI_390]|nr:hypothetical protein DL93DRAFT_2143470 [Clavulina sp. PMI_390]